MPKVVTQRCPEQDLNPRPTDRKPKCLTVAPPRHTYVALLMYNKTDGAQSCTSDRNAKSNQAQSKYKHSLIFRVWRYVAIAMKPVHQLQIRPIVHNGTKLQVPSCIRVRVVVWECGEGQTDTQAAVTTIRFASAMPHTNVTSDQCRMEKG